MPRKRITAPVERLEERLEALEAASAVYPAWQAALDELRLELTKTRELALEAVALAQDAQTTSSAVGGFDARLNDLTLAVANGIQHVERAENRIRATIQRARQERAQLELEPHPGLEAEADSLRLEDGARGEPSAVHPVRAEVGEDENEVVPLPGVPGRVRRGFLKSMGA